MLINVLSCVIFTLYSDFMAEFLKIATVNTQSVTADLDCFKDYFSKAEFHIICICESWLKPSINSNHVRLSNYGLFCCDRAGMRGGRGVI